MNKQEYANCAGFSVEKILESIRVVDEITLRCDMGYQNRASNTMGIALRGFDLYIRTEDGRWQFAASKEGKDEGEVKLISHMDRSLKD